MAQGYGDVGLIDVTAGAAVPEWLAGEGVVVGVAAPQRGVGARLMRTVGLGKEAPPVALRVKARKALALVGAGGGRTVLSHTNAAAWDRGNVVVDDVAGDAIDACGAARRARGETVVVVGPDAVGLNPLAAVALDAGNASLVVVALKDMFGALGLVTHADNAVDRMAALALTLAADRRLRRFIASGAGVVMPTVQTVVKDAWRALKDKPELLDEARAEMDADTSRVGPSFASMSYEDRQVVRARILSAFPGLESPEVVRLLSGADAVAHEAVGRGKASVFVRVPREIAHASPWVKTLLMWSLLHAVGRGKGKDDGGTLFLLPEAQTVDLYRLDLACGGAFPGVTLFVGVDSLQRLDLAYGRMYAHSLMADVDVLVAGAVCAAEDAETLSRLLGDTTVEMVTRTRTGDGQDHVGVTVCRRPLMTTDEIIRSPKGSVVFAVKGRAPVMALACGPAKGDKAA